MFSEKTIKHSSQIQQKAESATFFRKAGEDSFFGQKEPASFFSSPVQAKLNVSSPDDPQEKEADAVADRVMRMPEPAAAPVEKVEEKLQRKEDDKDEVQPKLLTPVISVDRKCEHCEKEEKEQAQFHRKIRNVGDAAISEEEKEISRKAINCSGVIMRSERGPPASQTHSDFERDLSSSKGSGSAMSQSTLQFMESRFSADFSGVRIHTGSYAENLSSSINAQAFTHGNDIYFNAGKYSPHTEAGGTLLAHELTHTIQQGASAVTGNSISSKLISRKVITQGLPGVHSSQKLSISDDRSFAGHSGADLYPKSEGKKTDSAGESGSENRLSNWSVSPKGSLQTGGGLLQASPENDRSEEKTDKENIQGSFSDTLQKKEMNRGVADHVNAGATLYSINKNDILAKTANENNSSGNEIHSSSHAIQNNAVRGPPVRAKVQQKIIQRSVISDAMSASGIGAGELLDCVEFTDFGATLSCFRRKARNVAMQIPGYKLVRFILGNDPITGENVPRSGRNLLEAAFDIMPFGSAFKRKLVEEGLFERAAVWIDGKIDALSNIVSGLISDVSRFINDLGITDLRHPFQVLSDAGSILWRFIVNLKNYVVGTAAELLNMIKDALLSKIVNFIKSETRFYGLLTLILGEDPITKQRVARNGTNILNAILELGGEEGREQRRQMQETGTFKKVAGYIDQGIEVFGDLYGAIVRGFRAIWDAVSIQSLLQPKETFDRIYNIFAGPVNRVISFITTVGAEILRLIKEVLMRRLSNWAKEQRGYFLLTLIIGRDPFSGEVVPFNVPNVIRAFMSLMEGGEEQYRQLEESGAISRTEQRITAAVRRLNMTPAYIIGLFTGLWRSFSLRDLAHPVAAFRRIFNTFAAPVRKLVEFVVEIVKIVIEVILQVMRFPVDLVGNIISRAMAAFDRIKRDPVGFLKNLLKSIKQGFIQFFDNILNHLLHGVTSWLMSELKEAGIPELTDFSLRGVISWVLNVLGISMEKIWEKLAAHPRIGPERVARLRRMIDRVEGIWTFIKDVQERGIAAIWDKIQEQLSNLWNTVVDAVKNWVMEQVVNRVTARLLSMLDPTGIMAVVNSAIAIYSAIQSFVKYLRQMLEVVNSFVNGVADIAEGNVITAANYLEGTMRRAMPIVIGFLANQIGLSGLGRRVGEMLVLVREKVDEALTWLVNRAVNTGINLLDRMMAMGRNARYAVMGWLGLRKSVRMNNGEVHTLYFEQRQGRNYLMMASSPKTYLEFANSFNPTNADLGTRKNQAISIATQIDSAIQNRDRVNAVDNSAIADLITQLSQVTIFFVSNNAAPPSVIEYGALTSQGGGTYANARILSKNHVQGSVPQDSAPIWANANRRRPSQAFIRGHLLNHHIGGPGHNYNLTPITGNGAGFGAGYANRMHLEAVEDGVKKMINDNKVVRYHVKAQYGKHADRTFQIELRRRINTSAEQAGDREKLQIMDYEQNNLCRYLSTNWATLKMNDNGQWVDDKPQTPIFILNMLPDGDFNFQ